MQPCHVFCLTLRQLSRLSTSQGKGAKNRLKIRTISHQNQQLIKYIYSLFIFDLEIPHDIASSWNNYLRLVQEIEKEIPKKLREIVRQGNFGLKNRLVMTSNQKNKIFSWRCRKTLWQPPAPNQRTFCFK